MIKITHRPTTPHALPFQKVDKMASFPVKTEEQYSSRPLVNENAQVFWDVQLRSKKMSLAYIKTHYT